MPSGPGAYPWTQLEPSGVGELRDVLQPHLGERVDDPLGRLLALLGRELLGVGDGLERDQLGEVVLRLPHQTLDRLAEFLNRHWRSFLVSCRHPLLRVGNRDRVEGRGGAGGAVDRHGRCRSRWRRITAISAMPSAAQIAISTHALEIPAASASASEAPASNSLLIVALKSVGHDRHRDRAADVAGHVRDPRGRPDLVGRDGGRRARRRRPVGDPEADREHDHREHERARRSTTPRRTPASRSRRPPAGSPARPLGRRRCGARAA